MALQDQIDNENAKAIQALTELFQNMSPKFSELRGITIDLNDDIGTKIGVIANALSKLGVTVIPARED